MKAPILRTAMILAIVAGISAAASAQAKPKLNTTLGYGEGKPLTFTYTQQYDCVEQPTDEGRAFFRFLSSAEAEAHEVLRLMRSESRMVAIRI